MTITVSDNPQELGKIAGAFASSLIRNAIAQNGHANIILATGTSQFETLNQLLAETEIHWDKVNIFHLDEYIGLPETNPASFRKYLRDRFLSKIAAPASVWLIDGEKDPSGECARLNKAMRSRPVDVALVGIGENGHLAFNDPPADFENEDAFIIVALDEQCRHQQFGEGWFGTIDEVPRKAITMTIKQIMRSAHIVCSVPDQRKALAVKNSVEGTVTNICPASILQKHKNCSLFLDKASASLMKANAATQ